MLDTFGLDDGSLSFDHYGTPRHSGRYPWGSGKNKYQRTASFISTVSDLKKHGMSDAEIAKSMGMTSSQLRARRTIYIAEKKYQDAHFAQKLKAKGYSNVAIGERMGIPESSVRNLLAPEKSMHANRSLATAAALEKELSAHKYLDVGVGVENYLGVSRTNLKASIDYLESKGYKVHYISETQLGTGKQTTVMVLASPGVSYKDIYANRHDIAIPTVKSYDNGKTFLGIEPPVSIKSDRIKVHYADKKFPDGTYGADRDGIIMLRPGVKDLSLGQANYAQVRIAVDGTHYLKGMAMYGEPKDFPKGVDVIFNTNKNSSVPKMDTFKKMKRNADGNIDPDNPFGATIKDSSKLILAQRYYTGADGKKHQSAINIVNEEGDWSTWSKTLSSQMLSKQSPELARKQLGLVYSAKKSAFDELKSLTNPVVKRKLLAAFADECDSSAVNLKAAALPRQTSNAILPIPSMNPKEIYAPGYRNGEELALIRYPHGGIFEIPVLRVNNKHPIAKKLLKDSVDAVGINHKVAEQLSGADFDGDTVLTIPTRGVKLKYSKPLKALADFDPSAAYPAYPGMPKVANKNGVWSMKQTEMGKISNLITDMTIKGAPQEDIVRAVKHSMVVIDAEKHNLNYKQSYIDNGIAQLKKKYQGRENAGASTLISKASSEVRVHTRKELSPDPKTGERRYKYTDETYMKNGKPVYRTMMSTRMAETKDARDLSSGSVIENIYADHANRLKALANDARKISEAQPALKYSPAAKKTYAAEVESLKSKLSLAVSNKPLERKAQLVANHIVNMKIQANPDMSKDNLKKIKGQALGAARDRVGAKKDRIQITQKEWEAIQAGAVSNNFLSSILDNTDMDLVKKMATPHSGTPLPKTIASRVKSMRSSGATIAEIADALGVSVSSVRKSIDE